MITPEIPEFATPENAKFFGDALEIVPTLDDGAFDLLLCDPPYAMPATYYQARVKRRRWSDTSIMQAWWRQVMKTVEPKLTDNGMMCVFANAAAIAAFYPIMYECTTWLSVAVWDKRQFGMGTVLRNQAEFILVGSVNEPFGRTRSFSNVIQCRPVPSSKRRHLAEKPVSLIRSLILQFCPENGRVLDPFAGTQTVSKACAELSISCVSVEWDEADERDPTLFEAPP